MCFGGSPKVKQYTPAAAPAPGLGPAEVPTIGTGRERENKQNYGNINGPKYRMRKN